VTASDGFRSGTAVLAGRPNVGKSTLLNALVGRRISIVTPKPQTTRYRILGLVNRPGYQLALVDTPGGILPAGSRLGRVMSREADAGIAAADAAILVVSAPAWNAGDSAALARLAASNVPVVLAVNKIDLVRPRTRLLPYLERVASKHEFAAIVPVSAERRDNLDRLVESVVALLPEGPPGWPADQVTDRGEVFQAAEVLREKLMLALADELPYGIAVEIERFETAPEGRTEIDAVIWVERAGQRKIVIGAKGARLKDVGRAARLALNELFGRRVHLATWVKVREGWTEDDRMLIRLGHDPT
jgi:GTP-binding protein Era